MVKTSNKWESILEHFVAESGSKGGMLVETTKAQR
jgi:hypothetical protein